MYDEEEAQNALSGAMASEEDAMNVESEKGVINGQSEAMDVPLRPEEKRRLNWENGLYLAPLTTVGNLVSPSSTLNIGLAESVSHSEDYVPN